MDPIVYAFIWIVAALLITGVIVWGIDNAPAIDPTFKQFAKVIIYVVAAIFVILSILAMFGMGPGTGLYHKPR